MKVFLSYSFHGEDSDLVQVLERLLSSHNILIDRGRVGGGQLTHEVKQLIDGTDGLIALKTRLDHIGDPGENRWRSSPWIDYEYAYARDKGKYAIALVEDGVENNGPFQDFERIPFRRAELLEAILLLSNTLRIWKERVGIHRVVQIRPDDLGWVVRTSRDLKCRYRFSREGVPGPWVEIEPVPQPSGTLLYLKGIQGDDSLIEVEILKGGSPRWRSPATSQFITVEMRASEDMP
jgi:hypothetical protein